MYFAALIFDANRLTRAQPNRQLEFLNQIRGRILQLDEGLVVVANLENFRRDIGTTSIALAGVAIHYDFHNSSDAV